MHLLVLVLNKEEYLENIMTGFVEVGITGATIIDSVGMGRVLAYDVPIFAGLRGTNQAFQSKPYNKTIFTVVKDSASLEQAINIIDQIVDLDTPGTGLLFSFPLSVVKGIADESLDL